VLIAPNHIHVKPNEFCHGLRQASDISSDESPLDREISPFDMPQFLKPLAECLQYAP